ncbi:MAG TPA: hypothetical protein VFK44_15230 [Bacillales bacterium]|nr:hypothetical protein [Bacillales bacterium]
MSSFIVDFVVMAAAIIGLTAMLGVLSAGIGLRLFGRKRGNHFSDQTARSQEGWRKMTRE